MTRTEESAPSDATSDAPSTDGPGQLTASLQHLVGAVTQKGVKSLTDTVSSTVGHLEDFTAGGGKGGFASALSGLAQGESPAKVAVKAGMSGITGKLKETGQNIKETVTGGKGKGKGKGKSDKIINIVEEIDIGAPVDLVYDQWTQFAEFPQFMKKLEQVEQISDEKLRWKGQVFWSHRSWESTIVEQVPYERIVWRSKGDKGYFDGAVTFHDITPDLTRVLVVIVYHPQGFMEKTGNIWRAQGRRIRLELKHFRRHVMTQTLLHPDELEGWHGEIRDGQVVPEEELEDREDQDAEDQDLEDEDADDQDLEDEDTDESDESDEDSEEPEETDEDAEEADEEPEPEPARKPAPRRRREQVAKR